MKPFKRTYYSKTVTAAYFDLLFFRFLRFVCGAHFYFIAVCLSGRDALKKQTTQVFINHVYAHSRYTDTFVPENKLFYSVGI